VGPEAVFGDVHAVLFDLDGTLIDSAPDLGAAADKMRTDRGLPSLLASQYRPMAGAGARGMLGVAFGMTPEHPDYDALREEFFVNYENCMTQRTYAFEGVSDLLQALAERAALGRRHQQGQPFYRSIDPRHAAVCLRGAGVSGDTTPHAKPHPEPLLEAARAWACLPGVVSTWAMTSATSWPVWRRAWARWPPPMATWANRAIRAVGAHAAINSPLQLLQLLNCA
jgi:phosphoglycolate phosphatase-like HAD superfamily hydrolase